MKKITVAAVSRQLTNSCALGTVLLQYLYAAYINSCGIKHQDQDINSKQSARRWDAVQTVITRNQNSNRSRANPNWTSSSSKYQPWTNTTHFVFPLFNFFKQQIPYY